MLGFQLGIVVGFGLGFGLKLGLIPFGYDKPYHVALISSGCAYALPAVRSLDR